MSSHPFDYAGSAALVTGASRGIGKAVATELARRGVGALVLTARSRDDLETLADGLRPRFPATRVEIVPANLSEYHAAAHIRERTDALGLTVDLLVNNAGFGSHGFFHETDPGTDNDMIAVNVDALVALTHGYLPGMLERGRGGVVNVASTAGFQPVPYMAVYAATKAFVLSFSEAIQVECRERGGDVRVVALCPGGTDTSFGDGMHRGRFESGPQSTPEAVATAGLDALDRAASFVVPGGANYAGTFGARLLPREAAARVAAELFRPQGVTPAKSQAGREHARVTAALAGLGAAALVGVGAYLLRARKASRG